MSNVQSLNGGCWTLDVDIWLMRFEPVTLQLRTCVWSRLQRRSIWMDCVSLGWIRTSDAGLQPGCRSRENMVEYLEAALDDERKAS